MGFRFGLRAEYPGFSGARLSDTSTITDSEAEFKANTTEKMPELSPETIAAARARALASGSNQQALKELAPSQLSRWSWLHTAKSSVRPFAEVYVDIHTPIGLPGGRSLLNDVLDLEQHKESSPLRGPEEGPKRKRS